MITIIWILTLTGILISTGLYITNRIRFSQMKRQLGALTGVQFQTTWNDYKYAISTGFSCFGKRRFNELKLYLLLLEYIPTKDWDLWIGFNIYMLDCQIPDFFVYYIPIIQDTMPIVHEKKHLLQLLKSAEMGELTRVEQEKIDKVNKRLSNIDEDLGKRWNELMVALGVEEDVIGTKKEESYRQIDKHFEQIENGSHNQTDPALKELYTLTSNPEAPEDIKSLASNVIQNIEEKLASEESRQKDELIRMSAEVTIKTSKKYHGL